jgi:hypothetical protein
MLRRSTVTPIHPTPEKKTQFLQLIEKGQTVKRAAVEAVVPE